MHKITLDLITGAAYQRECLVSQNFSIFISRICTLGMERSDNVLASRELSVFDCVKILIYKLIADVVRSALTSSLFI